MATTGSGNGDLSFLRAEGREPGARRKKLGGYLKAANELRQSYFNQDGSRLGSRDLSDDSGVEGPGAFPDAAIVRGGHEEMMLFPSYARRHVKRKTAPPPTAAGEMSEQEYWRREFNRHQDDKAVVDVDVRGWIYTPHRGPLTRKHRLGLGVVRQLAGLPQAPGSSTVDSSSLVQASSQAEGPAPTWKQDQEAIAFEAEQIAKKGEKEKRNARRGAFSEEAQHRDTDVDSVRGSVSGASSREPSPGHDTHRLSTASMASVSSVEGDAETPRPVQRQQASFLDPARMSSTELATANTHLFNRFHPFLANPVVNATVSAFFYNATSSRQHTVATNASGHFTCRAPLDFVPTHVRVLAGEQISATEEVIITSPSGVSLISDIDDTIKHSGVSVSAREIFRNTFIRELGDLTIDGVREWYNTLHDMGVSMHYVSNSPWQLYPVLTTYFKMAHLPKGSFHLKQYSGMLQGIFEPVAERKKSNLEKIMFDFPDRKFVLVGDSGEADLEVYTDITIENPGRILGIFIRDVTTPIKTGYFDPSNGASGGGRHTSSSSDYHRGSADSVTAARRHARPYSQDTDEDPELKAAIAASLAEMEEQNLIDFDEPARDKRSTPRPTLPPRRSPQQSITESQEPSKPSDDLIDLKDEPTSNQQWLAPDDWQYVPKTKSNGATQSKPSPSPPPKPRNLRSPSPSGQSATPNAETPKKPPPPPRPRKPSTSVHTASPNSGQSTPVPAANTSTTLHQPSPLSQVTLQSPEMKPKARPALPVRPKNHGAITSTAIPTQKSFPPNSIWQNEAPFAPQRSSTPKPQPQRALSSFSTRSVDNLRPSSSGTVKAPPAPPPRVRTWNTTAASSRKAANRHSGAWSDGGDEGLPGTPAEAGVGRKEFLWNQRWARAKRILEHNGVTLRSWRVGSDVADVCVRLVEGAMREMEKQGKEPR